MNDYWAIVGLGYLVGLAVLGYAVIMRMINTKLKGSFLRRSLMYCLVLIHFILGINGILIFPSKYYVNTKPHNGFEGVIFGVVLIVMIVIAFKVLSRLEKAIVERPE